jgi:hypothetical protein
VFIGSFGLSDAEDSQETIVDYDEVLVDKFLHIHVETNLPSDVLTLRGKIRRILGSGTGDPKDDRDLNASKMTRAGQFQFVLVHYLLEGGGRYKVSLQQLY